MPFLDHLEELRSRLIKSILAIVIMSVVGFFLAEYIIKILKVPLGDVKLYNIAVTGTFYAYLKIALVGGVVGALPIIFYQMWSFIAPGLYKREKATIIPLVIISTVLFAGGATFCYFIVLPLALKFLVGFASDLVINAITVNSYISFFGLLELAFGFAFQLPIVAYFLGRLGIITSSFLARGRRYAIVLILIVGAVITPPDVFTQVLLAIPLYVLYEISILVVRLTGRAERLDEPTVEEAAAIDVGRLPDTNPGDEEKREQ